MSELAIRHHPIALLPDMTRVIIRPFIPGSTSHRTTVIGRALAMTEPEVEREVALLRAGFSERHRDFEEPLREHFARVERHVFTQRPLSPAQQFLIGALFSGEYSVEAAALFNPSIVPHPDQGDTPQGALRFMMSLRATGEGHISSIAFRSGTVSPDGGIELDPITRFASTPVVVRDPSYRKRLFIIKLHEMGLRNEGSRAVMEPLGDSFNGAELAASMARARRETMPPPPDFRHTLECIQWLADSNYELRFSPDIAPGERIIFPVSTNESCGIEDARFVRFVDDNGAVMYYATYTAYSGRDILPQLIETEDFLHFRVLTLNGSAVQNKGMALFPRRVGGNYVMLSRQDDENLFIMFSDNPHYWSDPHLLLRPAETWESVKVGNCGSPIETEAGWLVITHGVGPLRRYCIGAALLDLDDPTRVIGRLREPLIEPDENGREGYVPNVVYSCGAMRHGNDLILPYAMSDRSTTFATIPIDGLLAALMP